MKKISKFTLLFFLLLNFFTIAKSEIIEGFCLVKRSDLDIAKLATGDYYRFLGKEIKFLVSFDENLLADASDDGQLSRYLKGSHSMGVSLTIFSSISGM